jgi:hypothetical protein
MTSAEVYDPATGDWIPTGSLRTSRHNHTATLLPDGRVLVAGGCSEWKEGLYQVSIHLPQAEVYDMASGTWTPTGDLKTARYSHSATLLPDGRVLLAGGHKAGALTRAELYDPATGEWSTTGGLNVPRDSHTATLLGEGQVLVAGGIDTDDDALDSTELYDTELGYASSWRPEITAVNPPLNAVCGGAGVDLIGTQFQGLSEASGGSTNDSATNYPLAQMRRMDNDQVQWLEPTRWSDTSLSVPTLDGYPLGMTMITLFVNGIPSVSRMVPIVDNLAPVAVGDSYTTTQDSTLIVTNALSQGSLRERRADKTWVAQAFGEEAAREYARSELTAPPVEAGPGVLANDLECEDDPLTASYRTGPEHGFVTLNPDGSFMYIPQSGFSGVDSFTYNVSDGAFTSNGEVTINVVPTHPPVPLGDSYGMSEDEVLAVVDSSLLDNDSDPDGDPLTAWQATEPVSGTVVVDRDGEFIYVPDTGEWGVDHFDYVASDGIYTATAQVTITITPVASAPLADISSLPAMPDTANLSWTTDSSNCEYRVWQTTSPHLLPGDGTLLATLPKGSDFFSVPGVIGDPGTNYYFVIEAVGCGLDTASSNEVAEFDFSLEPGG